MNNKIYKEIIGRDYQLYWQHTGVNDRLLNYEKLLLCCNFVPLILKGLTSYLLSSMIIESLKALINQTSPLYELETISEVAEFISIASLCFTIFWSFTMYFILILYDIIRGKMYNIPVDGNRRIRNILEMFPCILLGNIYFLLLLHNSWKNIILLTSLYLTEKVFNIIILRIKNMGDFARGVKSSASLIYNEKFTDLEEKENEIS